MLDTAEVTTEGFGKLLGYWHKRISDETFRNNNVSVRSIFSQKGKKYEEWEKIQRERERDK